MSAGYYAQYMLNDGQPVAQSIPASEHSVMTAWATEREALEAMVDRFGDGAFAVVMDSYDWEHALRELLPAVAAKKIEKGGFMVLRPDSGDPTETVLQGLHAAEKVFGVTVNRKGYKIPNGCSVIQGDGINLDTLGQILDAVLAAGFSSESVAFGMGGGLLQKVNRDTLSFATKLCHLQYADGTTRDVMKAPKTDSSKFSLPGILQVRRDESGVPTVYSVPDAGKGAPLVAPQDNLLRVVYDKRPVPGVWDNFSGVRARVAAEWNAMPKRRDPISQQLNDRIREISPAHANFQ
jgi:nicotinamide phosphoribosyltransferase